MTQFPVSTSNEQSIYGTLELSKNSWLLAIQVPGRDNPSLYPIRGGNAEGLMAKLDAARGRAPIRSSNSSLAGYHLVSATRQGMFMFKSKEPRVTERGPRAKETDPQTAPERETSSGKHSIIPAELQITGDLVSPGDITCRSLTLTGQPVIQGSVEAETVRVSGTFNGKVQAKMVSLTKAARMTGEIYYETLEIEPGASFEGKLSCLKGCR